MKWIKVSDNEQRSGCGNYSVRAEYTAGTLFYEARCGNVFLARREDTEPTEMQRVCERHRSKAAPAVELHENNDGV